LSKIVIGAHYAFDREPSNWLQGFLFLGGVALNPLEAASEYDRIRSLAASSGFNDRIRPSLGITFSISL
jgi:hypothetical protein